MPKSFSGELSVNRVRTRISCPGEGAKQIFLAGTFNGWNTRALPMQRNAAGEWTAEVDLVPGVYQYKFVIDGEWSCEPGCDSKNLTCEKCVPNPFGTMNRKLEVA